jgi:hypothetical protein
MKRGVDGAESSNSSILIPFWRAIWNIPLARKCQSFLWKFCKNVLPTQDNLVRRNIYSSCGCAIYEEGEETTLHVLKDCLYAKKVWACCG